MVLLFHRVTWALNKSTHVQGLKPMPPPTLDVGGLSSAPREGVNTIPGLTLERFPVDHASHSQPHTPTSPGPGQWMALGPESLPHPAGSCSQLAAALFPGNVGGTVLQVQSLGHVHNSTVREQVNNSSPVSNKLLWASRDCLGAPRQVWSQPAQERVGQSLAAASTATSGAPATAAAACSLPE